MYRISQRGLDLIKKYEGFSSTPYYCPAGKKTIGYGHVIKEGEKSLCKVELDQEQAEMLLLQDVAIILNRINVLNIFGLNQNQVDALASFIYNIGLYAFEKSTLFKLLQSDDLSGCGKQFQRWTYANGRKLPGLEARRVSEAALFNEKI